VPLLGLITATLGSILAGLATPTEAAAVLQSRSTKIHDNMRVVSERSVEG
jgi:TRAP-type mannitol/chloroaromatic compound transport system permease large subunit